MRPFLIVYGMVPRAPLDLLSVLSKTRIHGKAEDFLEDMQQEHKLTQTQLEEYTLKYKAHADTKRRHVEFNVGDLFGLS